MSLQPVSGPQTPMDFIIVIPSDVGGTFLNPEGLALSSSGAWVSLGHLSIRPCFPGHRVQGHWDGPDSLQQRTCPSSAQTMVLPLFTPWLGDHGWPALPKGPQERESGEKLPPAGLSLLIHRAFQRANPGLSHTGRSELWEPRPPVHGAGR